MNISDSQRIATKLEDLGYKSAPEKEADLVVVNACSVRQHAVDLRVLQLGRVGQVIGVDRHGAPAQVGVDALPDDGTHAVEVNGAKQPANTEPSLILSKQQVRDKEDIEFAIDDDMFLPVNFPSHDKEL